MIVHQFLIAVCNFIKKNFFDRHVNGFQFNSLWNNYDFRPKKGRAIVILIVFFYYILCDVREWRYWTTFRDPSFIHSDNTFSWEFLLSSISSYNWLRHSDVAFALSIMKRSYELILMWGWKGNVFSGWHGIVVVVVCKFVTLQKITQEISIRTKWATTKARRFVKNVAINFWTF